MVNRIVAENLLPGSPQSQWDIGYTTSWTIEGFATQISCNAGETVHFKIKTDSTDYRIDIYRLGYYDGMGGRLVHTLQCQRTQPQVQPPHFRDNATGLVDAGNWAISASWPVPATAVSGIYIAKLVRQDGTFGENHIAFVVREDGNPSDVVFQTSDTTWQAYNIWGGVNLYGGDGPGQGSAPGRAYKVSYNRPFVTRWGGFYAGPQDWIFSVEYPMLRWLEMNGYDVTYISGLDTHRDGGLLLNRKIFLSVGHDEYWSGQQRSNVEAARDHGKHLAFLSGNEVYWRTRWEPSAAGPTTPDRTLVCYKETREHGDIDPSGEWTGTFRDPRFAGPTALGAGQPENALTGTIFTCDSYRLDTIKIPYEHSQMRFWRNTDVALTLPTGTFSLPTGYLGYEWDSDLDNGHRPAGVINLSQVFVDVHSLLLDHGTITGPGTAEHNLTLYRTSSGALVFGAGTVYWAWGLDTHHDNEQVLDDKNVKQGMVNLFAEMDVQPATLDPFLVAATASVDFTPPVSTINPPSGPLPHDQPFVVTGTALDTEGVIGGVELSTDNGATWHKTTGRETWSFSWTPSLGGLYTLRSRAVDDSGNIETPGAGTDFTVSGPTGNTLFSSYARPVRPHVADLTSLELGMKFSPSTNGTIAGIRFYKAAENTGTHSGTLWSGAGSLMKTATFINETAIGWQTALFDNPVAVTSNSTYIASYHTSGGYAADQFDFYSAKSRGGITALADSTSEGNGVFVASPSITFPNQTHKATNYWVDVLFHPTSIIQEPPVAVDDTGFVTESDTALTIAAAQLLANDSDPNGDSFLLESVGSALNGTVSFDGVTGVVTFTPTSNYTGSASFTYTIKDSAGGTDTASVTITVVAAPMGQSVFASTAIPAVITANDANSVELGMRFVPASNGTINGIRFYKGPQNTGTHTGRLWAADGTEIANLVFVGETATGWQTALFAVPPTVLAGVTYTVSYHTSGFYSVDQNYFASPVTSGALTAPSGSNGAFAYGTTASFPNESFNASNYWVDVLFSPTSGNLPPLAVDDYGLETTVNVPLQIPAATLLANDGDPNGGTLSIIGVSNAGSGSVSYDANTSMVTFTPAPGFVGPTNFTYTISDGQGGEASGLVHVFVMPTGVRMFAANSEPATVTVNDAGQVELGMRFSASTNGVIKGIRFYKGPQNIGSHTGTLWTGVGVLIDSVAFSNETPSGWQTALFLTPIPIIGGQDYVVSYHSNGHYSATTLGFATSITSGALTAPSTGNGVFAYGSSSFPNGSFDATNYWVDLIFE